RDLALSPDGRHLVAAGSVTSLAERQGCVHFWDMESGEEVRRFPTDTPLTSVAFSQDGRLLACAAWDPAVILWDVAAGKEVQRLHVEKALPGYKVGCATF